MSTKIFDTLTLPGGSQPVFLSGDGRGGCATMANFAAISALTGPFKDAWMIRIAEDTGLIYQLQADLTTWSIITFGGGSSTTVVNSAAALTAATGTAGALAWHTTRAALFVYNGNSTATVDSINVFATGTGGNTRWMRTPYSDPTFRNQATHFIDGSAGNDDNDGLTVGTPILTATEWRARVGRGNRLTSPTNVLAITWINSPGVTDPFTFDDVILGKQLSITLKGTPTIGRTGSFDTFTPAVLASNTLNNWTEAAHADWTTDKSNRVKITTAGAHQTAFAWVYGQVGGNPTGGVFSKPLASSQTVITPSAADAYQIETLTRVMIGGSVRADDDYSAAALPSLTIQDLDIGLSSLAAFQLSASNGITLSLVGCRLRCPLNPAANGTFFAVNCLLSAGYNIKNVFGHMIGTSIGLGGSGVVCQVADGATITFDGQSNHYTTFGMAVFPGAACNVSRGGFFDTKANALFNPRGDSILIGEGYAGQAGGGGRVSFMKDTDGAQVFVYGSSTAASGVGLFLHPSAICVYDPAASLSVTGTAGDFRCGQTALSLASIDPVTNAARTGVNQTWALLPAASVPGPGFDGTARSILNHAAIMPIAA